VFSVVLILPFFLIIILCILCGLFSSVSVFLNLSMSSVIKIKIFISPCPLWLKILIIKFFIFLCPLCSLWFIFFYFFNLSVFSVVKIIKTHIVMAVLFYSYSYIIFGWDCMGG